MDSAPTPNKTRASIGLIIALIVGAALLIYWLPKPTVAPEYPLNQDEGTFCIQVITPAINPQTGETKEFPTPCEVPEGWEPILNAGIELIP